MKSERSGGVLLHPTSLPGSYGIGDLGPAAYHLIDFLEQCGLRIWQILPLGPTGYGDSPYQCFSSFAGNPMLISPEYLVQEALLDPHTLDEKPDFSSNRVDFGAVIPWKKHLFTKAFESFCRGKAAYLQVPFEDFLENNQVWLDDFCLFMTLKDLNGSTSWVEWEVDLRDRDRVSLDQIRNIHQHTIRQHAFIQFLFHQQWNSLHKYAADRDIKIIGDAPIFVAHDSSDVWGNRELFLLDRSGRPKVVAGVPPDYFSPTGQLWGNPLYRWKAHAESGFSWWISRLENLLTFVDIIRLDHFRGFCANWEVPGKASTAEHGRWAHGPGKKLFHAMQMHLASAGEQMPIIAEDLGVITPDVVALREAYHLPGMKVLQFAFGGQGSKNPFLPHNYKPNCVAYTGTHDNDTTLGWFSSIGGEEQAFLQSYIGKPIQDPSFELIRLAWSSTAEMAIAPMQDLLALGNEARMNYPGSQGNNWTWRMQDDSYPVELINRMQSLKALFNR